MGRRRPNPPPMRDGVSASSLVLPAGPWRALLDFLNQRFPGVPAHEWYARLDGGLVLDDQGKTLAPDCAYTPGQRIYYYRAISHEVPIRGALPVLW